MAGCGGEIEEDTVGEVGEVQGESEVIGRMRLRVRSLWWRCWKDCGYV